MRALVLSPLLLLFMLSVNAATLIEREDEFMGVSKMWVDGNNMRVETDGDGSYMVVKFADKQIFIVDQKRREIIDASEMLNKTINTEGLDVQVKRSGKGPVIAGYPTRKYDFMVNGHRCEQSLVSMKALKDSGLESMIESLSRIDFDPRGDQFKNPCEKADAIFALTMKKIGLPLAELDGRGRISDKIIRIKKNSKLPSGEFERPSGYRSVSLQQVMKELPQRFMEETMEQMSPEQKKAVEEMLRQQGPQ